MTCELCKGLAGSLSKTGPHPQLKSGGRNSLPGLGGSTAGHVWFYQCAECGAQWGRDMDSKDKGASWYRTDLRY